MKIITQITFFLTLLFLSGEAFASDAFTHKSSNSPAIENSQSTENKVNRHGDLSLRAFFKFQDLSVRQNQYYNRINPALNYDLADDIDLNIGLLKTKPYKTKYNVRSAKLPRGRHFEPVRSKLGANITKTF